MKISKRSPKKSPRVVVLVVSTVLLICLWISTQNFVRYDKTYNYLVDQASHDNTLDCIPKVGLRPLKNRNEIPLLLEEHGFETGIEVGVKRGQFSKHMLDNWKSCKTYHLVDLWAHQENYKDFANVQNDVHENFYQATVENTKLYQNITKYHRMYSTEAAKKFEKESIDFIYIDARHDYCGVMEDIELYWPILKPGGIIAGHDYNDNSEIRGQDWGLCGDGITRNEMAVKGAVNDFFLPKGYTISVIYYRQNNFMSWMVQKRPC